MRLKFISLIVLFFAFSAKAQLKFTKNYFRSPIDYRIVLSGNFGELRSNHFHSGIDLKTGNKIGKRLYAIADGYVSRINVSPYGYGLALYIDHSKGYTSVYGHLYMFNDKIQAYVKEQQYKQRHYTLTIYPDSDMFKVKKGELVGISGDSGHSYGPHLHFEIRDTKSEHPMNTLNFGLPITDKVSPRFFYITKFPLSAKGRFIDNSLKRNYTVKGSYGKYYYSGIIPVGLKTALGYRVHDYMNYSPNRVAVYRLEVFLDDEKVYEHQLDEFDFEESRYLNSHVDFEQKKTSNKWVQKCYLEPNNRLRIYKKVKDRGIITLNDFEVHNVKVVATDIAGNESVLNYKIRRSESIKSPVVDTSNKIIMPFGEENRFSTAGLTAVFPKGSFYDTLFFEHKMKSKLSKTFAPVYSLHQRFVPVHKYFDISIQSKGISEKDFAKALIVKVSPSGRLSALESETDSQGLVSAKARSFGEFSVALDKTPPYLKAHNIYNGKNVRNQKTIEFKLSDNLSGVDKFNAYIDGKWVVSAYYYMKKKLIYTIDSHRLKPGKHKIKVVIEDGVGNKTSKTVNFVY